MVKQVSLQMEIDDQSQKAMISSTMDRIECFTMYPLLFSSLLLHQQQFTENTYSATGGYKIIGNIQKLIHGKILKGKMAQKNVSNQ